MYMQSLKSYIPSSPPTLERLREPECSSMDLQYEICSRFMKMTSQKLYLKQLELIQASNKFIDKVNDNMTQKDISSTQESTNYEPFLEEEDPFSQPTRSKLLLRKSQSNSNLRRSESGIAEAMREVKKHCSERTSSILSNLVGEFRRIKEQLTSCEKYQKEIKKQEAKFTAAEEELILLRKKVSDLQKQTKTQANDAFSAQKKLKQITDQARTHSLSLSKSSDNLLVMTNSTTPERLKKYLSEKQVHIFKKEKQISKIQDKIQKSLDGIIYEQGCQKCCVLVKRIKDSIIKYRSYLQEEAQIAQTLYNNYKRLFS